MSQKLIIGNDRQIYIYLSCKGSAWKKNNQKLVEEKKILDSIHKTGDQYIKYIGREKSTEKILQLKKEKDRLFAGPPDRGFEHGSLRWSA